MEALSWKSRFKRRGGFKGFLFEERDFLRPELARAVLQTLAYGAVFNYPLKKEEVWQYLISRPSLFSRSQVENFLKRGSNLIREKEGYYFLPSIKGAVEQRKKRKKIALKKFARAEKFSRWAKFIPTIKLIGVSGALAVENAHKEDDIDIFIIAERGAVWTTRFLLILLAEAMKARRRPEKAGGGIKDKMCLNMFIDEDHMQIPEKEQSLFSAHEVVQMKPLYIKDNIYSRFIKDNLWVRKYLPNAVKPVLREKEEKLENKQRRSFVWGRAETVLKRLQLRYMSSKKTNEVIKDGYLRFHPSDMSEFVLRRFDQILREKGGESD